MEIRTSVHTRCTQLLYNLFLFLYNISRNKKLEKKLTNFLVYKSGAEKKDSVFFIYLFKRIKKMSVVLRNPLEINFRRKKMRSEAKDKKMCNQEKRRKIFFFAYLTGIYFTTCCAYTHTAPFYGN